MPGRKLITEFARYQNGTWHVESNSRWVAAAKVRLVLSTFCRDAITFRVFLSKSSFEDFRLRYKTPWESHGSTRFCISIYLCGFVTHVGCSYGSSEIRVGNLRGQDVLRGLKTQSLRLTTPLKRGGFQWSQFMRSPLPSPVNTDTAVMPLTARGLPSRPTVSNGDYRYLGWWRGAPRYRYDSRSGPTFRSCVLPEIPSRIWQIVDAHGTVVP